MLLATMLVTSTAIAQDDPIGEPPKPRRYTVEVIVFSYAADVSVGTEIFPPDAPPPAEDELLLDELAMNPEGIAIDAAGEPIPEFTDATVAEELDETVTDAEAEEAIPELLATEPVLMIDDEFSLQRVLDRLELLEAYRPIMHAGWTQATLPLEESTALDLAYFGEPPTGLSGSFTLYLGRYLHLVVDLTLDAVPGETHADGNREPVVMFGDEVVEYDIGLTEETGDVRYRIQEDRIVKNGDVRYFDHPKFGVVAKIMRIEEPEEEPGIDVEPASAPLVAVPVE